VTLRLAVLIQCRLLTDRRTDGRTQDIYRANIASRGKPSNRVTRGYYASKMVVRVGSYFNSF